jgi:hypothetical protein
LATTSFSKEALPYQRLSSSSDVSIDRVFLGFGGVNEPEAGSSNKEKERRVDALKLACQRSISPTFATGAKKADF